MRQVIINASQKEMCDLCGNMRIIYNECCGMKVCFPCDAQLVGLCSVCKRKELNLTIECDKCECIITLMTSYYCWDDECDVCHDTLCNKCIDEKHPHCFTTKKLKNM